MNRASPRKKADPQWAALARNDWGEVLELLEKKAFQRKFQIIEAFTKLVAEKGFHRVTHQDLARKCNVTRPLITHHFPTQESLVSLCFRTIYARFQKLAADALLSRAGFKQQLKAYVDAVAGWVDEYRSDTRFLVQFYALLHISPELQELHDRNIEIGRERISSLCKRARSEGHFKNTTDAELHDRAYSVQKQLLGFLILHSARSEQVATERDRRELWRSVCAILGI